MADPPESIRKALEALASPEPAAVPDRVYLFVSFDLVNSTAYKAAQKEWPVVISKFYELSVRELRNISPAFHLWKFTGDEVLMFRTVTDVGELAGDIISLHEALNKVVDQMGNTFEHTKNFLSVKGTVWLARATHMPPQKIQEALSTVMKGSSSSIEPINIVVNLPLDNAQSTEDFLGPDVDVGFRIAKFADKRKLVVSANLAKTLMMHSPRKSIDMSRFKVVTREPLKGVWAGRPYPIIWYHDDWKKIEQSFYYDDADNSPVVRTVLSGAALEIGTLDKIYSDLNRDKDIERIREAILATPADVTTESDVQANRSKLAEVHCAAVCFRADGKILLGRRPATKRKLRGVFEFGCGQLRIGQGFEDCLREGYKEDFSAELGYISHDVINTYVIAGERKVPGLLFYAELNNPDEIGKNFLRSKHTEIQWFDLAQLDAINPDEFVPDFKETVNRAVQIWRERNVGG